MTDSDIYTYVVQIRLTISGSETETVFDVLLTPADDLSLPDGSAKALQDCTLADIQKFAQDYEESLWEEFENESLLDLSLEDDISIKIIRIDADANDRPDTTVWMEHLVILEDRTSPFYRSLLHKAAARMSLLESSTTTVNEDQETAVDEETPFLAEQSGDILSEVPVSVGVDNGAMIAEQVDSDIFEDLLVEVAEPEPVHEEREISELEEPTIAVEKPEFRILGMRRPLNHKTWTAVDILINEPAFRDAQAHAMSSLDREVAGVLVGPPPEKQPDGRYVVHISDIIIARHTKMQGASVTYTPESWRYVNDKLTELYPEDSAVIVGWYHTHPGFGIFLSNMDQFIHHNFFVQIWHIAFVLDPHAQQSGFFCWDRKREKVKRYEFPWPDWAEDSW